MEASVGRISNGKIFLGNQDKPREVKTLPPVPPWRDFTQKQQHKRGEKYKASEREIDLVNAAIYLRRPLLVTGRPGVGKTSLAYAVAWELMLGEVLLWPINTRSTLQQGLYDYDAIARVRDASVASSTASQSEAESTLQQDIGRYMRLGPLGTALVDQNSGMPRVLLIDEIDKSDIDLPNDLLNVFEEGRFEIRELARMDLGIPTKVKTHDGGTAEISNGEVRCTTFPIVILTSNGEREFPPAFLRRCLRLDIDLPKKTDLENIVQQHLALDEKFSSEVNAIIAKFLDERDGKNRSLATDQLLNAIFLAVQGIDPIQLETLREAVLRPLVENG